MSLLLLTLASDPYDRPGHWMPWRRRCGAAEDLHPIGAGCAEQLSTRSLQIAHDFLVRAIRHAEADDLVDRNVAALVRPLAGQEGRPSKGSVGRAGREASEGGR